MKASALQQRLAGTTLPPAILVAGSEPLLVLEAADAVRARARELGFSEREVFDVDARFDWNRFTASLAAPSLFASRRLLELRLPTGRPGREGSAAIQAFCEAPPPDVVVLVVAAEWSRSHEGAWSRAIEQAGLVEVLWAVKPAQLPAFIGERLRAAGIIADFEAAALLAERIEGNLLAAVQEIEKLALLKGSGRIDAAEMDRLVADSARFNVFGMIDAAMAGDATRVVRMLAGLRGEGEAPQGLVAMLAGQLAMLSELARVQAAGGNLPRAMQQMRVWPAKQPAVRHALGGGSVAHFDALLADCARVEKIGKGREQGEVWRELERLLLALAQPRARLRLAAR